MRFLAKANVAHFLDSPPLLSSVRVSNIVVLQDIVTLISFARDLIE